MNGKSDVYFHLSIQFICLSLLLATYLRIYPSYLPI